MIADIAEMTGEAVSEILFAFDLEDETPVESKEEVQTDAKIDMIADIAEMTGEAVSEILFAFDLEDEVCAEPAEMAEAGEDTEVTTETVITDTYDPLKEIETDAPVSDASMEHGRTDNAESDMLTLFEGVIMDDEIVPMACVPEISSAVPGGPTSEVRAMDDGHAYMYLEPEINKRCATMPSLEDEVWNVHFSFPSEKNQSSSADVRFNWG
jgi:hypothetical protein